MDLREFVKTTLVQIIGGVQDAQKEVQDDDANAYVAPITLARERNEPTSVSFDVAVTATESAEGKAGGGIRVWALRLGASGSASAGTESISRIQFAVPVVLPGRVPAEDERARGRERKEREADQRRIEEHKRATDRRIV